MNDHPWMITLVFLLVSGLVFAFRFSAYSKENPRLKKGYTQIIAGYFIIGLIPTLIMFLADMISGVTFKKDTEFNYWSLSLQIYGLVISLIGLWWIFLRNGAEFLSDHPGLLRFRFLVIYNDIVSVFWIKAIFTLIFLAISFTVILKWISYSESY